MTNETSLIVAGVSMAFAAVSWALALSWRRALEQRARRATDGERILRTVVDGAPVATVLIRDTGRVVLASTVARDLFAVGKPLEGQNFLTLIGNAPVPFREAMLGDEDALFTVGAEGDADTFRLTKRHVEIDGEPHALLMVEEVTRELRRQEVDVWKKLIRVISHELNNSLAPISSMIHSARTILQTPEHIPKLVRVFDTVEERTKHLQEFLAGYARFARLPKPRAENTAWTDLLARARELHPTVAIDDAPDGNGWFDRTQMEQVLLNLVKNAVESGSKAEDVRVRVDVKAGESVLFVSDRGPGMSPEVLANALVPFYSTKEGGTGLGLALCREIVEAHGGKIRLQNREGGGLEVSCTLPPKETRAPITTRLTLTHA